MQSTDEYGYACQADALFFKTEFNCSSGMFSARFHFLLCLFAEIAFCASQNSKGGQTFSKTETMQL